jgi:glutaredoxin
LSVIIYTVHPCGASEAALKALTERGVEFEERRVDHNVDWWNEALNYSITVPVIIWENGDIEIGWGGDHGCEIT